jgi:hypothetical protein
MAPGLIVTRTPRGDKGSEKMWGYRSLRELPQEQEAKDIGWLGNVHSCKGSGTLEEREGSLWTRRQAELAH